MKNIILTFILGLTTTVIFSQKKHTFKLGLEGALENVTGWVEYTNSELKVHYDQPVNEIIYPVNKTINTDVYVVFYTSDLYKSTDDIIRFKFIYTSTQKLLYMDTKDKFTGAISSTIFYLD